ncbi:MAG: hypothetical protein FWD11_09655 [Micrococcales bacterium]|nr:hypothetical protein [Micrococcales bacterium]
MQVLDGQVGIETIDDRQHVRITSMGAHALRELPDTFRVIELEHRSGMVVLRAEDGAQVCATPGQLALPGMVIPAALNPDHQEHLEAELFGLSTVPAPDADDPVLTSSLHDDILGTIVFDPVDGVVAHDVPSRVGPVQIRFWACGHDRVATLLPFVHDLLDELPAALEAAVEFLWQWGATGGDTADSHKRFLNNFGIQSVSIYHSGAFSVELSDDQTVFAESFLAGYWPAVHFLIDGTPIFVTIEC